MDMRRLLIESISSVFFSTSIKSLMTLQCKPINQSIHIQSL